MGCGTSTSRRDEGSSRDSTNKLPADEVPVAPDAFQSHDKVISPEYFNVAQLVGDEFREYHFKELSAATQNFSPSRLLGEGSFGRVYKGELNFPTVPSSGASYSVGGSWRREIALPVAIKRLGVDSHQGYQEWMNEILFLSQSKHPNLVRLIGQCQDGDEMLLVYEYCPKGSLHSLFFGDTVLTWHERISVALDAARGLAQLHSKGIIHRDLKPGNVLVRDDMSACLTDFGFARLGPDGNDNPLTTRVLGTMGFLDPAYMTTGKMNQKADLYSLGVLLAVLLTGRHAQVDKGKYLMDEIQPWLDNRKAHVDIHIDTRLKGQYPAEAARKMKYLVHACTMQDPRERPTTDIVVESLVVIQAKGAMKTK